jgi:hypothetical protein
MPPPQSAQGAAIGIDMHVQNVKRRRAALRRQAQLRFGVFPKLLHLFLAQQLSGIEPPFHAFVRPHFHVPALDVGHTQVVAMFQYRHGGAFTGETGVEV